MESIDLLVLRTARDWLAAGERVLLISHGGVMRLLLAQARDLPREQLLNVEVGHGGLFNLQVCADGALKEVG